MSNDEKCCKYCEYVGFIYLNKNEPNPAEIDSDNGLCRRYPPVIVKVGFEDLVRIWPDVDLNNDWCGEFK